MVSKLIDVIVIIGFAISIYTNFQYSEKIAQLESQLSVKHNDIKQESKVDIGYVPKSNQYDNDIEIKANDNIKVKVDDKQYNVPIYIKEESRLEKGKIVVEKQSTSTIELSGIVDNLAEEKAHRYSRVGTFDVGAIYNKEEKDLYAGFRANAKAYDVGYYHQIDGDDWLIAFHYKF